MSNLNYKSVEYFLRDHPSNPALPLSKRYEILFVTEALSYGVKLFRGDELGESKTILVQIGSKIGPSKRGGLDSLNWPHLKTFGFY